MICWGLPLIIPCILQRFGELREFQYVIFTETFIRIYGTSSSREPWWKGKYPP
jgi:hypothetical protein